MSELKQDIDQMVAAGEWAQALALAESALTTDVAAAAWLRDVWMVERRRDRLVDVLPLLQAADSPESGVSAALVALLSGNAAGAAVMAESLIVNPSATAATWHLLGRALFNLRRSDASIQALEQAVAKAPADPGPHISLGHVVRAARGADASLPHFQTAMRLAPGWWLPAYEVGNTAMGLGDLDLAIASFRAAKKQVPQHPEVLLGLALALHWSGAVSDARTEYEHLLRVAPTHALGWRYIAHLHDEAGDVAAALSAFDRAIGLDGKNPELLAEKIAVLERSNRLDEASAALLAAVTAAGNAPALMLEQAKLSRRRGRTDEALACLDQISSEQLASAAKTYYWFERGHVLDILHRPDDAFTAFQQANAMVSQSVRARRADRGFWQRQVTAMTDWLDRGAPANPAAASGDQGEDLCFLVGFPRSGTTLLELMLDAHPDIATIEERPTIETLAYEVEQAYGRYPDAVSLLSGEELAKLRRRYRDVVRGFLAGGVMPVRLVDKMPIRTVHVPFIARLFPAARFIFCLRDPLDVALSNYMQHYAVNDVFVHFNDLPSIARIYDQSMTLWQRTVAIMAPPTLTVRYEDLVADRQPVLDALAVFLGVGAFAVGTDHRDAAQRRERVNTNSYHQVTQAVNRRAVARWKRHEAGLASVRPILDPWRQRFGYIDS